MSARRTRDLNSLPSFTTDGVLPVGDYPLTLDALRSSLLVLGPDDIDRYPNWDASWRLYLVNNLTTMVEQLWKVGISEIYIDGSFVEDKEHPNDIDGYFECELKHDKQNISNITLLSLTNIQKQSKYNKYMY